MVNTPPAKSLTWVLVITNIESPLDCQEIQPVHPEGDLSWVFFGRIDAKAETPILWPSDGKNWLREKDPDARKDWRQEEKGTTEDEMAGCHHRLDGHEFEWTPGVGDGQGGLACCDSWGRKESDTTEWLNWTEEPTPYYRKLYAIFCNDLYWRRIIKEWIYVYAYLIHFVVQQKLIHL